MNTPFFFLERDPVDFEEITLDGAAASLDTDKIFPEGQPARKAVTISVETAAARYRIDGGTPTAALGHPLCVSADPVYQGDYVTLVGTRALMQFRAIKVSLTAKLMVTYYA
jgi:hypothetical protein